MTFRAIWAPILVLFLTAFWGSAAFAQGRLPTTLAAPAVVPATAPATMPTNRPPRLASGEAGDLIQLNFPQTVELRVILEYVAKRLNLNIIYDESIGATKISLTTPNKVRQDELLQLLQNVLKMADMELVKADDDGWYKVGRKAIVEFVPCKYLVATELAKQASAILEQQDRVVVGAGIAHVPVKPASTPGAVPTTGTSVSLIPDLRTNRVAVVGTESDVKRAAKLIKSLDIPSEQETRTYHFRNTTAARIDSIIKARLKGHEGIYSGTVDEGTGMLFVTARAEVHKMIEALQKELDIESDPARNYVQFYKLTNTTATNVLLTIQSLQGRGGAGATAVAPGPRVGNPGRAQPFDNPSSPQVTGLNAGYQALNPSATLAQPVPGVTYLQQAGAPSRAEATAIAATSQPTGETVETGGSTLLSDNVTVSADENTNTIIVVAPPDIQRIYRQLIAALDKRRPQVMVEVTLVAIDTSDNYRLGVELSGLFKSGDTQTLIFSSFGLSTIDQATGRPTIITQPGLNLAVIDPDAINAVVQALEHERRARVLSAPKILMNDNATGLLASVAEQPYSSVNASDTVSTTSFGGYAEAGTTISVTPHISEGDYLQVKYSVALNTFTATSTSNVTPPPRQTDQISSEVTVPDGYAVVVGGLTRRDLTKDAQGIPVLVDIPIIKYLFGLHTQDKTQTTLFVFIRPVILRDDRFADLKYLSQRDLEGAGLPPNLPRSEPMSMH